jgi:radical SAM superfamily enzyme YgiQ (UPF0313 family)
MKIALIYPPSSELNLKGYPLGLGYLSASLRKTHEVNIYNWNGKEYYKSIKILLDTLRDNKPDLVGISFNSFNRSGAYRIIKNIKRISKDIIVVLGGVHPATLYSQIFQYFYDDIDFIIQSEGERALFNLCNILEKGGDPKNISGLVYKVKDRKCLANPVTDIIDNLDDLPIPDFSYAEKEIRKKETAYLITSRGCPVNCSFCSTSSFWGQKVRMNSPERVGREVEYVKSLGAKRIFFQDDTFNLGIERTIKIADILKGKNIDYAISCRVNPVNEEMVARLADSGCKHITWGVESLSEKILESINKKITKEQVKYAFDLCAKYSDKMTTGAFTCVGIPGESEKTVKETIDYFNQNIKSTHGPGTSILYILPGTKVYHELVAAKKFNEKIWINSGAVCYYTLEHNIFTLNRWRKQINHSGIKLPYNFKYFWDSIPDVQEEHVGPIMKRFRKTKKKFIRYINLIRNRY